MLRNLNFCCCFNNFSPLNYVKFENDSNYPVHCIVQYTLNYATITEEAHLTPGHTKKITLPPSATNICLNMLNLSDPDPITSIIYHECISGTENICYKTLNTAEHPIVTKTLC